MKTPWKPGSWNPRALSAVDTMTATYILEIAAMVRAYDYITPGGPNPSTRLVEAFMPLPIWGWAFAFGVALLIISVQAKVHRGVWLSNWLLAGLYAVLSTGLILEYLSNPWADGIRTGVLVGVPCVIHAVIALRTGWKPLED